MTLIDRVGKGGLHHRIAAVLNVRYFDTSSFYTCIAFKHTGLLPSNARKRMLDVALKIFLIVMSHGNVEQYRRST